MPDDDLLDHFTETGFDIHFKATFHEVKLEPDKLIPPLLQQARDLFDLPGAPKGRDKCRDCELLELLIDLSSVTSASDERSRVASAKLRRNCELIINYHLLSFENAARRVLVADSIDLFRGQRGVSPESLLSIWDFEY